MNGPRGIARLTIGLAVLALGTPATAPAQEGGPLLKSDLVRMMTASNYTATEMAAIVRMNCVGFDPTPRDRNQLGNLPNADVVMAEIDRCTTRPKRQTAAAGQTASSPDSAEEEVAPAPPPPRRRTIELGDFDLGSSASMVPGLERPKPAQGAETAPATASADESLVETPPELKNWKEVSKAFLRAYRPNVRQPGTVLLWLRVGPDGRVTESRVKRSTGDPVMADAALEVTELMEFEPATRQDRPVESWTELPINFSSK